MIRYLLDTNVLIALIDPIHIYHNAAHDWFSTKGKKAWASCPIIQNGVLRIVGNARYPNSPGSPAAVLNSLRTLCELPGHVFWPDSISLLDTKMVNPKSLLSSAHLTDTYLLALANANGGQLATFDKKLVVDAVQGGKNVLHLIQ